MQFKIKKFGKHLLFLVKNVVCFVCIDVFLFLKPSERYFHVRFLFQKQNIGS